MTQPNRPYTMYEFRKDFRRISKSADEDYARIRNGSEATGKPLPRRLTPLEITNDNVLAKIEEVMTPHERQDPLTVESRRAEEIAELAGCSLQTVTETLEVYAFVRDRRQEFARVARKNWLSECAIHFLIWGSLFAILLLFVIAVLLIISD